MVHSIICLAKNRVFCEVSFMLCLADDHSDDDDDTHNKGPKLWIVAIDARETLAINHPKILGPWSQI